MRKFAYLISLLLLLPTLVLACIFVIFGHVIAATSLFDFLFRLLMDAIWTVPLVGLGLLAVLLGLLVAGLSEQLRWIAALCVALLALASSAVVMAFSGVPDSLDGWLFFLPSFVSFGIGIWLATTSQANPASPVQPATPA